MESHSPTEISGSGFTQAQSPLLRPSSGLDVPSSSFPFLDSRLTLEYRFWKVRPGMRAFSERPLSTRDVSFSEGRGLLSPVCTKRFCPGVVLRKGASRDYSDWMPIQTRESCGVKADYNRKGLGGRGVGSKSGLDECRVPFGVIKMVWK